MTQLTNSQLGLRLHNYHMGDADYIYGVGSLLFSNQLGLLTPTAVRGAIRNLRIDAHAEPEAGDLANELERRFAHLLVEVVA